MNLERFRKVAEILTAAGVEDHAYFDMQHDVLYIPWEEETGHVATHLEDAGCHWDDDADSWASF